MKIKVIVLLATVAALHLVLGGLFLAGGCAQEDPPMPPGIYVPPSKEAPGTTPAQTKSAAPESVAPAESSIFAPQESVQTPKEVKPGKKAVEKTGTETVHKVVKGDSLWSLSRKYSISIEELALFNNLPANARLKIGQTILIPPSGKVVKAPSAKAVKNGHEKKPAIKTSAKAAHSKSAKGSAKKSVAKENIPSDGSYVIKAGDNFSTIAKKFGVKVSDITAANPGVASNKLKIGQKINLPGKTSVAAVEKTVAKPDSAAGTAPAENAAPAGNKSQNMDSLLEDIPNPDAGATSAKSTESAPVASKEAITAVAGNAAAPVAATDTDKLEDLADGTGVAVTTGAETTLAKLSVKYKVKEADVKLLNPAIPADGKIKAGMVIKLP